MLFVGPARGHFFANEADGDDGKEVDVVRGRPADNGRRAFLSPVAPSWARIVGMPEEWCDVAVAATASVGRDVSHDEKFRRAAALLDRIAGARVVVTSRLHTALPAMAMGVPCMFVLRDDVARTGPSDSLSDQGHDCTRHDPRFGGLLDRMRCIEFSELVRGLPASQWAALAASPPESRPDFVAGMEARVREFVG